MCFISFHYCTKAAYKREHLVGLQSPRVRDQDTIGKSRGQE